MSRKQWLMIFFIPMAFSFVCPTEVLAFNNVLNEFTELDCSVIFVSTDSKYSLYSWQTRPKADGGLGDIEVPLLSDQNHKFSRAYGVLDEDEGYALRGRFIINPEGIVKHISINDVAVGRSVLESLRLLQAYKAEYEHGVFCAANWKPGDATLSPSLPGTRPVKLVRSNTIEQTVRVSPHHNHSVSEGNPSTPRGFAMEAIQKVFGHGGTSKIDPEAAKGVEAMNALNEENAKNGHRKTASQGSVQSYFDFEPFDTSAAT